MRNIKKVWLCLSITICLCLASFISYGDTGGNDARVFDQAGLLSADQIRQFEQEIADLRSTMNMDVVVVTTNDAGGNTAQEYADQFYINGNFGVGDDYSGILFLIDMENRELYITPVGKMIRFITDERNETILDHVYAGAQNGDFAASVESFLTDTATYYEKGIQSNQYNYDAETGKISVHRSIRWYEALFAVAVSAFVGLTPCLSIRSQYGMKKERERASNYNMAYRADCNFAFNNQNDDLINKFVTQAIIPRVNHSQGGRGGGMGGGSFSGRSTTHSSSGRTFGGGGRKF